MSKYQKFKSHCFSSAPHLICCELCVCLIDCKSQLTCHPTQQKLNNYIQSGSLVAAYSFTLGVTTNSLLRVLCVMRCDGAYVQPFTQLRRVWFKNIHLHLIYPYVLVPILDMYVCRSRYSL